jgi:S1 RNA binding domain protein
MAYDIGSVMEGTVVEIARFGAFVKLSGGKTGLVHISEISDKFVQEVSDYLSIGAHVLVKIISIDEKRRIQLSMKALTPQDAEAYEKQQAERIEERKRRQEERPDTGGDPPPRHERDSSSAKPEDSFEKKLRSFMRQSEDRLVDVKRSIESKRGTKRKKK